MKLSFLPLQFLLLIVQLAQVAVQAQDKKKVDSLEHALKRSDSKVRIDILFLLGKEFYDVDNKRSLDYIEEAFHLANQFGDSAQIVQTGRARGQLLRRADKLEESIAIFKELEPIALRRGYEDDYKKILNGLAISYTYKAAYDEALKYHFKSLAWREHDGNKAEISITLHNIATVYGIGRLRQGN